MIGQTVSHYRFIEKLGEGGMGVVYLAEDTHLGRRVAVKFLSSLDPPYRARFLREARAVSTLAHPNIAAVYDYGETPEGHPYIVMEFVKGETLGQLLDEDRLTLAESLQVIASIAEALAEAHHQGIVHRDIKPSNVVISERGQVKVLDFGLVKQVGEPAEVEADPGARTILSTQTRSDVIVGTPLYLSPEQATGKPVDGRSDLFALGTLLYECITGRAPFAGSSVIEIGAQVIHVNPPPPSRINPSLPAELDRITMKALEKRVESRYQSADEMLADLRTVPGSLGRAGSEVPRLSARPTSDSIPLRTSALTTLTETFRRPRVSLGTLIIAAVIIGFGAWALVRTLRPTPYRPSATALDWYNKGTEAMRNGAFLQATLALKQAISADPKFALAHARLAEALTELDYTDDAKNEILRVNQLVPNRSQLPRVDALYLEAMQATVSRDFPVAIKAYNEIVKLSQNESHVYFDLGRAYEKNDETKKAIENYIQVTNLAPQFAAAFLRLGVLYGRQLELATATANFQQAETIYKALGSFEGEAEVFYERGFVLNKLNKVSEAREQFQRALDLARTAGNQYQEVKTLLKLGDVEIDAGNLAQARQHIEKAIDVARSNGIDNLTKRGLVDLGNTYLVGGDYVDAERHYQESLELALKQKDARNAARAYLSLASLSERQGNSDEVIRNVERALPFYKQGGYRKEFSQAVALLARTKVQRGEYEAALQAYKEQLKIADELGDQSQAGVVHRDIAFVLTISSRYPEALTHLQESQSIAKRLGVQKDIGLSLVMSANALWRLGRYDDATTSLTQAEPIAEQGTLGKNLSAWYSLAIARMSLSQGEYAEARTRSEKALGLAGTQLKGTAVESLFTRGLSSARSGAITRGVSDCERAVEIATENRDPGFLSEALLALAEIRLLSGDTAGALAKALSAQDLLARLGRHDAEWIAWTIAAQAARIPDSRKATEYATRAQDVLSGIEQKWGAENYRTYLSRRDVQSFRKQLSELPR